MFKNIDNKEFEELMNKENTILLDIRSIEEYEYEHIGGAKLIEYDDIDFEELIDSLDRDKTYLLYCRSGRRSFNTMILMEEYNFSEVYNLKDGILSWEAKEKLSKSR